MQNRFGFTADLATTAMGIMPHEDVDAALEVALTPAEAQSLRDSARDVFKARLLNLGVQFSLAVQESRWRDALEVGDVVRGDAVIPQAHPTGYPIYRLEWQGLGSLQRRLRNCLVGMRAVKGGKLVGHQLRELKAHIPDREVRVAAIYRGGRSIKPEGNTIIEEHDEVFFVAARDARYTHLAPSTSMQTPLANAASSLAR